jgi:hypothetical protein
MSLRLLPAVVVFVLVGCRDAPTPIVVNEAEVIPLDAASLSKEFRQDRKAARERYVGKVIELAVERLEVRDAEDAEVEADLIPAGEPATLTVEAVFYLSDGRNASLRGVRSGPFRSLVRGKVRDADLADAATGRCVVKLDPAWVQAAH